MGALILVLLQAASVSTVASAPTDSFQIIVQGRVEEARVAGNSLAGPNVQASWTGSSLRGSIFERAFDLTIKGDRIEGMIGGRPVNVQVAQEGTGLRLQGLYGGQ